MNYVMNITLRITMSIAVVLLISLMVFNTAWAEISSDEFDSGGMRLMKILPLENRTKAPEDVAVRVWPTEIIDAEKTHYLNQNTLTSMLVAIANPKNRKISQSWLIIELPEDIELATVNRNLILEDKAGKNIMRDGKKYRRYEMSVVPSRFTIPRDELLSDGRYLGYDWFSRHHAPVLWLKTALAPGSTPGKVYMKMEYQENGKPEKSQTPESSVNIGVLEEIRAEVPKVAKSGIMARNTICLSEDDIKGQKAVADYLQKLGYNYYYDGPAQKFAPKGLDRWSEGYNIWHANAGLVHMRDSKVGVGNGFEVYVKENIPQEIKYIDHEMKPRNYAISPWALYHKHPWVVKNILDPIKNDIASGRYVTLWANWEPFMYMESGDFSNGSKKEFIKWSKLPAEEVGKLWPYELLKKYPEKWRDFRNWELGQWTKVLAETIYSTSAKTGKKGYFAIGTVSDYLTETGLIVDYKKWDDFPYIYQTWTYHLGSSSVGPYPITDRSGAPIVQRTGAVAEMVDKLWKGKRKPLLSCIYGTIMADLEGCSEFYEPERNAFAQLSTIMSGMDVVSNYPEWSILDGRYASQMAKANTRIAYWDDFILNGERQRKHVVIPVSPYPETVPLHVLPEEQAAKDWESPRYLVSYEYKNGDKRLFAVANTWDEGECFFRLRIFNLDKDKKYILTEPEERRVFTNNSGTVELTAEELEKGLILHVGGIRWGAFLLKPASQDVGNIASYKKINSGDVQKILDSRLDKLHALMKENEQKWGQDRKSANVKAQLSKFTKPLSRLAVASETKEAPRIDGTFDDACWKNTSVCEEFTDTKLCEPAKYQTTWRAVLYNGTLYLAIKCKQDMNSLVTKATERDGRIWCDDSVEIFINALEPTASWDFLQIIINPSATVFDMYKNDKQWNKIENVAVMKDKDSWNVEMAIPLKECFPGETTLRVNLIRNVQTSKDNSAEISSWFPVLGSNSDMSSRGVLILK